MPTYRITDQETGRVFNLTGDSPPTEAEIEQILNPEIAARDTGRSVVQGATFGFGDELTGFAGAALAKIMGDKKPFAEISDDIAGAEREELARFREESSWAAGGAEAVGAIATGGAGAARALGTKAAASLPKWLSTMGIGAVEGGIYGAGAADPGERTEGAATGTATGAVLAPVLGAFGTVAAKVLGATGKFVAKRLFETPKVEAVRLIREAAQQAGLSADDVAKRYERLGPDGMLMDTDENFRALMRALADKMGPAKRQAREALEDRQLGQVDRLVREIEDAAGMSADDYLESMSALAKRRAESSKPFYDAAFEAKPNEKMLELAARPSLKGALARATRLAADEGEEAAELSFKQFHFAKMVLDDRIGTALRAGKKSEARSLLNLKRELLAEMDEVSPDYRMGRDLYAGDSALLQAAESGRAFYSMAADEMAEAVRGLGQSEREMFKQGAVKAIVDKLDESQLTYDNAKRLVNSKALQKKLGLLFKDDSSAAKFVQQAVNEREFARSRAVVTGGSPTSQNLAAGGALEDGLSPVVSMVRGDSVGAGAAILSRLLGKTPRPETIQEATNVLLAQGLKPDEVRSILTRSKVLEALPKGTTVESFVRGSAAPVAAPPIAALESQ